MPSSWARSSFILASAASFAAAAASRSSSATVVGATIAPRASATARAPHARANRALL